MAKTPSSKLFDLAKSLTGSEKRYFKIFISNKEKGNNKYSQLFDAIDQQQTFNDEALRQTIYGQEKIETRKYSELKSYLYELILKSLQSYDEKSSVDYKLKNTLLGVRTLFKRSHFEDCKGILKKAKKLAIEYEDFNTLIEILNWEKKIAYAQTDIAFLDKELDRISDHEKKILHQLNNISAYRSLFFKILVNLRTDVLWSEKQNNILTELMANPLMENEKKSISHTAKVLFFRIESIFYFSSSKLHKFYESSKKLLDLMESKSFLFKEDVSEYISALNNHIISCGTLKKYTEVRETLDKLIAVKPLTQDDSVKIQRQYYMNKFRLCITSGEFDEGLRELKKHLKSIKNLDKNLFNKNTFYLQYFYIYFGSEDYNRALNILNEWMHVMSGSVERKDLQSLARVLNLIIHYELGNTVLLDSLIRSTYRYLNKENRLSEIEKTFINFIKEAAQPKTKKQNKQALEQLKSKFEGLSKLPDHGIFNFFDVNAWIESKISGKSFAETIRAKFQKTNSN